MFHWEMLGGFSCYTAAWWVLRVLVDNLFPGMVWKGVWFESCNEGLNKLFNGKYERLNLCFDGGKQEVEWSL